MPVAARTFHSHWRTSVCAALACASLIGPARASEESSAIVKAYLAATAERLPAPARAALKRIDDAPRQLLAARSYMRAAETLVERWSWSDEQIRSFARTSEHGEFLDEVVRVRAAFDAQNPGYTLRAGTQVRSLDVQLQRWNENASVGRVAQTLASAAAAELKAGEYPAAPTAPALDLFARFLRTWRPETPAPLAAPGLSLHGQLRAIDFHVEKDGRIIAGTQIASVRSIWERQGWARKLQLAVEGSRFVGPLRSPNEPWHYEYVPSKRLATSD
ncbi:MAG: hypothetical protein ACREV5_01355 [Steroidobacter sp.]